MNQELRTSFIDTHCHLDFPEFDKDRPEVIQRAKDCGIAYLINIGSSLEGSKSSIELSRKYDFIYASVGIHPHQADGFNETSGNVLRELAKQDKVVAIGEIGLDYYKNYSTVENQKSVFVSLVKLAKDLGLPVIIHNRQAEEDILKILKEALPIKAVIHCFSADEKFLREVLDLGFYISYTCNITYKKAQNLRDLIKKTPLERMFLETDAPFLPPEGLRGKRNEPHQVKRLAQEIAEIKGMEVKEVARITTAGAKTFFNLK
jgi:TatD DNase family protein